MCTPQAILNMKGGKCSQAHGVEHVVIMVYAYVLDALTSTIASLQAEPVSPVCTRFSFHLHVCSLQPAASIHHCNLVFTLKLLVLLLAFAAMLYVFSFSLSQNLVSISSEVGTWQIPK